MNFADTPQEAKFRAEAKAWLKDNGIPRQDKKENYASAEQALEAARKWQMKKYEGGWACLHWPREYGGRGATPMESVIWAEEEKNYSVPRGFFEIGQGMAGPVLMKYATEEQKNKYLPKMASGEEIWCQMFSENSAGSDVAGLMSKVTQQGKNWTLNGSKVWTSGAHFSDYAIIVARHDFSARKHKGLTYFFLDLKSDGVNISPIKQLNGGAHFNQTIFDNVVIPDGQRLGEIGDGWKVVITTLMNERVAVGDSQAADTAELVEFCKAFEVDGMQALDHPIIQQKIAEFHCLSSGLKYTKMRTLSSLSKGATPGPQSSITKIVSAKKQQDIARFVLDLAGPDGLNYDNGRYSDFLASYMSAPGFRIAGGTDEILRNIIAERVLGLPQDPRADKNVAFDEIPTAMRH